MSARLTKKQREAYNKMQRGEWYSARELGVRRLILDNLRHKGRLNRRLLDGCGLSPDTFIVYQRWD